MPEKIPLPVLLAASWLALKVVLFYTGWVSDTFQAGVFLNLLFLVVLIYAAIRRSTVGGTFFDLVKASMRPAAMYVVLVSIGIFIYYSYLDDGFMDHRLEEAITSLEVYIEDNGGFEAYRETDPSITELDKESYLRKRREELGQYIFSPFAQTSYSILALTVIAFLYSLFMSSLFRFMASRVRR